MLVAGSFSVYCCLWLLFWQHNKQHFYVIVFGSYVISLSQPRRQQMVCKYWYSYIPTSCFLRKRLDWQTTLRLSVRLWVDLRWSFPNRYVNNIGKGCEHFIMFKISGSVSNLRQLYSCEFCSKFSRHNVLLCLKLWSLFAIVYININSRAKT